MTAKKTKTKTKHGGRKPGSWKRGLTAASLRTFRKANRISRARLAEMIGVSQTTIQNWETDRVFPTDKNQVELERVMAGTQRPATVGGQRISAKAVFETGRRQATDSVSRDETAVTGQVVSAYLAYLASAKGKTVTKDGLCDLVRSVKDALA